MALNFSLPFIVRPIATILLSVGLFLAGAVAYRFMPVAALPSVEFPAIHVSASRPGADPSTMAATVAAPLERRLGEIPGVIELTSTSTLGTSSISILFDISRRIDSAARDVQAALNAAVADLPGDLPSLPSFRKANPAGAPILILALSSEALPPSAVYDVADTVVAQRIAQVDGVAEVSVAGAEQPAIRVRVNPVAIAAMGLSMEDVRLAIINANAAGPLGMFDADGVAETIATNTQMRDPGDYRNIVVKVSNGAVTHLGDIATVEQSTRNSRSAAWFNGKPAILISISKQADANVIETVDRIHAMLPELKRWVPASVRFQVVTDRTLMIRASVRDMQFTLLATIALVMLVVSAFLRRTAPTVAVGITVPLSLSGTCICMWLAGFSIDNLSLMALAVSVGFVVDDAIVMIENTFRNMERGLSPLAAAVASARQISFTVVSISVSLIAAFIPMLFMGGLAGRLFREFSVTLAMAIVISTFVSLSVTPMICARFLRGAPRSPAAGGRTAWLDHAIEGALAEMVRWYDASLQGVLRWQGATLAFLAATMALTVYMYVHTPKGFFPPDDSGFIGASVVASQDISFQQMIRLQKRAAAVIEADPAVAGVGSSVGGTGWSGNVNVGRLFIGLKPLAERGGIATSTVVDRMRLALAEIPGLRVYMWPAQQLPSAGGRSSQSQYQFTLMDADAEELALWLPRVQDRIRRIPGIIDVTTDQQMAGLQANVVIDRTRAARLGLQIQDIDNALNNAFSQRQISTVFTQRNQYRVILETDPQFQQDPMNLNSVFIGGGTAQGASRGATQVPLAAVARIEKSNTPVSVNHQGQFPAATVTWNLTADTPIETAANAVMQAVAEMHLPDTVRTDFAGDMKVFRENAASQELLILAALAAVYIVLGVLYESLAHPLTIISTLPSAGLGALMALTLFGAELTIIAFIGIILLIGIVKKNGIMLVDFALAAQREGRPPEEAIRVACLERFRPILMTTLAALLGAVPLLVATGTGSDLRRPLGMTIIGGLAVSQLLTLYTTPVVYLLLDRLHRRSWGARRHRPEVPAE